MRTEVTQDGQYQMHFFTEKEMQLDSVAVSIEGPNGLECFRLIDGIEVYEQQHCEIPRSAEEWGEMYCVYGCAK